MRRLTINSIGFPINFAKKYAVYLDRDNYEHGMKPHQKVLTEYLANEDTRGVLAYHQVGSGKTRTALAIAEKLERKTIIFLPKSLQSNFIREYSKIYGNVTGELPPDKFQFASSNAPNKYVQLIKACYKVDPEGFTEENRCLDDKFLIIDEAHSVISLIINPSIREKSDGEKIFNLIFNARNLKLILLTGTPLINNPYEMSIIFNLCKGPLYNGEGEKKTILPLGYTEFNELFVTRPNILIVENPEERLKHIQNEQILAQRITGMCSYFPGRRDNMPEITSNNLVPVHMSEYQWSLYLNARLIERNQERRYAHEEKKSHAALKIDRREVVSTFRTRTRHISNFAFPEYIEEPDVHLNYKEKTKYYKTMLTQIKEEDLSRENLLIYSPKMLKMLDGILQSEKKKILVYSQFKEREGIKLFAKILDANGWSNYLSDDNGVDYNRYVMWHGDVPEKVREKILLAFNEKENARGKNIRVFMITSAGSEGISLRCIRAVHIMEPYWNESKILQIIGRGRRMYSHNDLPENERNLSTYVYKSILPDGVDRNVIEEDDGLTTDEIILKIAHTKQILINEFDNCLKRSSIDCSFNRDDDANYVCLACVPTKRDRQMYTFNIKKQFIEANTCIIPKVLTGLRTISNKKKKALGFNTTSRVYVNPGTNKYYIKLTGIKPDQYVEIKN